jgi:hypothetical protein
MMLRRGASEYEITNSIRTAEWQPAESGRLECKKDFPFGQSWNGKLYKTKQIRPIFVEEENEIVIVTVYVYYF